MVTLDTSTYTSVPPTRLRISSINRELQPLLKLAAIHRRLEFRRRRELEGHFGITQPQGERGQGTDGRRLRLRLHLAHQLGGEAARLLSRLGDELVGAKKSDISRAFRSTSKGKLRNRVVLRKFTELISS